VQNTDGNGKDYTYDAVGNVVASTPKNLSSLSYDAFTQMTQQITTTTNEQIDFEYGGDNQRVLKIFDAQGNTTKTLYLHGMNAYPLLERKRVNSLPESRVVYIYGLTGLLAMQKDGSVYYAIRDHLGSTRVLLDENGNVMAFYDYAPFGNIMRFDENVEVAYRFTGQEYDAESGLHNYRARLYDSDLGRFCAMDAAGQTPSRYLYAGNNPVLYVDKDGRLFGIDDLIISGVSFLAGYVSYGIQTGNWGKDALASGLIAAGSSWLAYNTGGAAAGMLFSEGTSGFAIASATIGGAVGSATSSAASQLYFTGRIEANQIWQSTLAGTAGGLAGGLSGQYLTSDPIFPGVIGGTVSGGIEGSYRGEFLMGAFWSAYSSVYSSALTTVAYEEYGRYLAENAIADDVYGNNYKKNGREQSCRDCLYDLSEYIARDYDAVAFGPNLPETGEAAHVGLSLGRNNFGQHFILSKEGVGGGVFVRTSTFLRSVYGGPVRFHRMPYIPPDYIPPIWR